MKFNENVCAQAVVFELYVRHETCALLFHRERAEKKIHRQRNISLLYRLLLGITPSTMFIRFSIS